MRCDQADISIKENVTHSEFGFVNTEEDKRFTIRVKFENTMKEEATVRMFPFADKQQTMEELIGSAAIYLPKQDDMQMFAMIFNSLSKFHNLATTTRLVSYPGKNLITIDYGVLSITKETIFALCESIVRSILAKTSEVYTPEEETEPEEEAETAFNEQMDNATDHDIPFMTSNTEYVPDEFNLGVVEEND